jgi:signal transduction histidine kinase
MPTGKHRQATTMSLRVLSPATVLGLAVVIPTLAGLTYGFFKQENPFPFEALLWVVLVAVVELLPVPTFAGVQVGLGFPLLIAVAFYFHPETASIVALLGSSDPRELRREITPLRGLFNRSQVALAVLAASLVFHSLSDVSSPLVTMLPPAMVATIADYVINIGLVTLAVSITYRVAPLTTLRQFLGRGQEFAISYVGLGLLGTVLAKLYSIEGVGIWAVAMILAPLLFARQMLFRTRALEEAHRELQEREQILKQLSNAMAEERHDEREAIANYLHDDLAQTLFRLSIQVDVARRQIEKSLFDDAKDTIEKIRAAKQETSDRVRALIRDLHRSPLGPKGLAEALRSFTEEMGADSGVAFFTHVENIDLPAPIALLVYHIAREGVTNALKHAKATEMYIDVTQDSESFELELRDNGVGFDTTLPGPEGHFGMAMMRERAQVAGGSFEVDSAPQKGTSITVRFPTSLLQQDPGSGDTVPAGAAAPEDASPGTSAAPSPEGGHSPQTVRA